MNYYEILNIDKKSTQDEIKKMYRKLSLKYHPDKSNGDSEKFKQINEAYQILGDTEKRQRYDMQHNNPFLNMGFNNNYTGMNQFNNGADGMNDIFKMFFGGEDPFNMNASNIKIFHNGNPVNVFRKPTPIIKTIEIDLEKAYNGLNYGLLIERWVLNNNIKKTEKEKIYIPIPRGIDNNEIIILKEKGNIINDTIKGDIKLFVKIINNTKFKRDGLDLIYEKNITLKEALTNFSFYIDYFNDKKLEINNDNVIIYPNFKKSINGLGLFRNNKTGSLIINFNITFPKTLTEKQKTQLKEIL
jgi:DnaJ-class molecular chaperone